MTTRIYGFTALTGGGTGSLDKYPEAGMPALATDDYAIGHVSGLFYLYRFDGASAEAESSPDIIAPDSGSGRWILKSLSLNHNDLMNIDGGNVSPEEYYHLASALYNVINSATAQSIIANPTGGATSVTNVTVAEQTLVGRITGGNVDALSVSQIKTLLGVVSDTAYAASWDGVTDVAPSKNAVYDKIETLSASFPSGTKMLFYQDTAPTGWTIENTLDDKLVYITKGSAAGGQTGGAVHSSGTWTQPNHTHTTANSDVTVPAHTHTFSATSGNVSADHTHGVSITSGEDSPDHTHGGITQKATTGTVGSAQWVVSYNLTSTEGASARHTHSVDGDTGGQSANHTHDVSGTSGSTGSGTGTHSHTVNASATANTWRPAAYCVIIATKD